MNLGRRSGGARRFAEERALPPVALDAMDNGVGNIRKLDGDHQAGEAGAGAHVDPSLGLRRQRNELGRIRDMAGPDRGEGRIGDEVGLVPPAIEHLDEGREPLLCFT